MFRYLLLTILSLLFSTQIIAQGYYPPIENYSSNEYGDQRNPENYAIVQDQRGVIYFGNANGVLEYDGKTWNYIEVLRGAFVTSLAINDSNVIYVGSNGEFGYLKANDVGLLEYQSLSERLSDIDKIFGIIHFTHTLNNEVFFQSGKSVFKYNIDKDELVTIKAKHSYHTSFVANNSFYARERQHGIVKWNGSEMQLVDGTEIFKTESCFGMFYINESEDEFLLISNSNGIYKLKDSKVKKITNQDSFLETIKVFSAVKLSDGNLALSTFDKGVFIIDDKGNLIHTINRSTGLRSADVKAMYEDRDQNLWLGLGNGISKVNYFSPLSFYNEKSGIEGDIQTFIRYNDLLYVGSSFGLYVQDTISSSLKEFRRITNVKDQIWDFSIINNELYIATTDGVFKQEAGRNVQRINYINTNKMLPYQDKIITAGSKGVYVFNENFGLLWKDDFELSSINAIKKDPFREEFWIGTNGDGVIRLIFNGDEPQTDRFASQNDGLTEAGDMIVKPIIFQDSLIFGSYGTLDFFHEDEFRELLKDDGLTEEELNDPNIIRGWFDIYPFYDSVFKQEILLIEEDLDRTWYVAKHKLGFYNKSEKTFINKPFWGINYGRINTLYLEQDGQLWIGCADGLIRYKKNQWKNYNSNFSSLIRQVIVDQDTVFHGKYKTGRQTNQLSFDFENNNISFNYSSPYFEDEHKPEYSCMLVGEDKNWTNWQSKNERIYTNLPAGTYTFKVKARNIYYQISDEATYSFVILPPWYETIWAYLGYVLGLIILIYAAVRISSMRLKARNRKLEETVEERTKEISEKNDALEHKNEEISEQKREIEDSINYAKRIQDAILPLELEMKKWLPNSFVLYRPKDIVSGDFYWFTKHEDLLVIVCADCTGHGVPGAFMSMIGSDRLNIIVNERGITAPGAILSELNKAIKKSLKQKSEEESTKDGMDAAICTVNLNSNELVYAGANRPLWMIKDRELIETKATKSAIAGFTPDEQIFVEHTIALSKGLRFYMSTDGYADQFGGPKGKKYMVRKMKKMLVSVTEKSFDDQLEVIENEVYSWMKDYEQKQEQIDDICVMGFEI